MSPLAAGAAGLGRLSVMSAPGQPFRAEIDLVAVKKEEKSSLSARLASQEIFRQANVDYLPLLSTFKATVETRPDGLPYVRIVSSQPIAEPLLNILIELNWSSGRLLREYTVVLAQPEHDANPLNPPVKPVIQAQSPVSAKSELAAEKSHAPAASARHNEKTPAESVSPAGKTHTTYGPVKQGDTLGGIAKDIVLPTGASFNQMLVALHRANPDAFIDGNMHQLKAGPVLRIPGSNEITAISLVEANKEVHTQTVDWNRRRFSPVAEAPEELKQTVTGEIDRSVEADSAAAREPAREVLKLSKGAEPWSGDKDGSNSGASQGANPGEKQSGQSIAQDRLHAMEEDITAKNRALREANERIALLEKNIRELQQLLELKNAALAEMQKRVETAQPEAVTVHIPPAAVSVQNESNPEAGAVSQPLTQAAIQSSSSGIEANDMKLAESNPSNPVNTGSMNEPVEIAKPVQLAKPAPEPGVRASGKGTGTIIDDLVANFEYLGGALVLLITGIVGVSMVRTPKSSSSFDSDEDSISHTTVPHQPQQGPLQRQHKAQEASMIPRENATVPAHNARLMPVIQLSAADPIPTDADPAGAGLGADDVESAELIKDEPAERSGHWREIMNKMDLARAYQEMDDKDAARQILHEVIREGDVGQQERARLILGNL
jgi:pilus assembly protein FimV